MATNLAIDDSLIIEAKKLGHHRTKKETVNQALKNYIRYMKKLNAIDIFGKIEFDPEYDYKKSRK
ncbi:MAG: type II toxin-antitoxin system VapB family antitoxin [Spirochaetes bacterium]|nr:type II toxin-antitoxin system VapB family antitoxin [Spirochaetota bacterium]